MSLIIKINNKTTEYKCICTGVIETYPAISVYTIITKKNIEWNHTLPFQKIFNTHFQDAGGVKIECYFSSDSLEKFKSKGNSWKSTGSIMSNTFFTDSEIQVGPVVFKYDQNKKVIQPLSFEIRE